MYNSLMDKIKLTIGKWERRTFDEHGSPITEFAYALFIGERPVAISLGATDRDLALMEHLAYCVNGGE